MNLGVVAAQVRGGREVTFRASGNSMQPRVKNGAVVTVVPLHGAPLEVGQVALAKVRGRWYLHLVTGRRRGQVQISNIKGHVNGWTSIENVAGVLKEER